MALHQESCAGEQVEHPEPGQADDTLVSTVSEASEYGTAKRLSLSFVLATRNPCCCCCCCVEMTMVNLNVALFTTDSQIIMYLINLMVSTGNAKSYVDSEARDIQQAQRASKI